MSASGPRAGRGADRSVLAGEDDAQVMSDEEWALFERFFLPTRARMGANLPITAVFLMRFSGVPEPERLGAACPVIFANCLASTASSGVGHWLGFGSGSWTP